MLLYRPVGPQELTVIRNAGWRAFPPRLPEQPIFYPVLNEAYAQQIARDWNSTGANENFLGFVTRFAVNDAYAARFSVHTVGHANHRELWVPAEELETFNTHIEGRIVVVSAYRRGLEIETDENGMV